MTSSRLSSWTIYVFFVLGLGAYVLVEFYKLPNWVVLVMWGIVVTFEVSPLHRVWPDGNHFVRRGIVIYGLATVLGLLGPFTGITQSVFTSLVVTYAIATVIDFLWKPRSSNGVHYDGSSARY